MKSLATVFWVICALTPGLFFVLSWQPGWAHREAQTRALFDAEAQTEILKDESKLLKPLNVEAARIFAQVDSRAPRGASETGLKELNGSVKGPLQASEWANGYEEQLHLYVTSVHIKGPSAAVLRWLATVTRHPRGYTVYRAELRGVSRRLEGTVEILSARLPSP